MSKMGYEGKFLGRHAQGIVEPIMIEERPSIWVLAMDKIMEKVSRMP